MINRVMRNGNTQKPKSNIHRDYIKLKWKWITLKKDLKPYKEVLATVDDAADAEEEDMILRETVSFKLDEMLSK